MNINVKEWLAIAGYPDSKEREAAIGLGAHFEVVAREGNLAESQERFEAVKLAYQWWKTQAEPDDTEFYANQERSYRMMLWIAEQTVKVIKDGDFKFPDYLHIDRKQTAAYYTPRKLIEPLLDSALQPLLDEATGKNKIGA